MQKLHRIGAAGLLLLSVASVRGEEWPMWRGPRGDGISRETGIADRWPAGGPKQVWKKEVGIGFASPVIVDGKLYSFTIDENDTDTLMAMSAESGTVLWTQKYESRYNGPRPGSMTGGWKGTRSSPVIEDDRIYTYGPGGDLTCRDLASGKEQWRTNVLVETGATPLEWGQASNPTINGNLIYVQGGKGGAVAVAVNKESGKIEWTADRGLGGYSKPVLCDVGGTQQLVVFGGDMLYGLNPANGKTIWIKEWRTLYDVNAATPIYSEGKLFVTSNYPGDKSRGIPAGHGTLFELSSNDAKVVWSNELIHSKFQPPILDNGVLYANSEGTVLAVKWADGKQIWKAKDNITQGGSLLRVGDKLIMLTERGKLVYATATPQGYEKIADAKPVGDSQVWSTPVLYKGKLYVKGTNELVCLDVSGK